MSCEYARSNGYQHALRKFHDHVNKELEKALQECKTLHSGQPDYWRVIGRQDILLEQLELISKWINEEK